MKNYVLNSSDFDLVTERNRTNRGGNAEALIQLGRIRMSDNKVVEGREFVKVVNSALAFFEAKYPFEYRYISGSPVIYLLDNGVCSTMAVDDRGVLYINVGFLYNKAPYGLEMQPGSVCNILYHECMHTFLSHVRRSIAFNEKNSDQKMSWQDMNIAADLEVNGTMVVDKVCTKNFWEMYKGCYYDDVVGLPMESIAKYYKHIINHFKNQPPMLRKSNENDGEESVIGNGMGDNGKSMYDAELHSGNGGRYTIIGEILRQRDISSNLRKSLEESGFDKDVVSDVCEEVESLTPKSNEELSELRNNIIKSKPKSGLAKICTDIKISDTVVENVWDEIVRKFLEHNTLFAGKKKKIADRKHSKWGDRRTLGIDMIRPYHPKGDASPQNINVLVDTSTSIDMKTTILFAQTLANCCDKLEYSGVTLIPFATMVDENSAVYFTGDDAKNDKEALINRIIEMAINNEAGGGTIIKPCVDLIVKYSQSEPKSVWIILTDGEFSDEKSLTRILSASNRILFVVYNKQFEKEFKEHLKWCVNPDYDKLSKCYIDLEKKQK